MAGEVIQQTAIQPAAEGSWSVAIFFGVVFLIGAFIYLLITKKKKNEEDQDHYLKTTNMLRQFAVQNADNKYFRSWWFFKKNVQVRRIFEVLETKKIKEEPLIGNTSYYMGHFIASDGKVMISVATQRQLFVMPTVELMEIPEELVDFQDDSILVRCVGMERKSTSTPYWPIVRKKDGKIHKYGFTLHDEYFREKVATTVIEEQGNLFKNSMSKVVQLNPKVKISQHGKRIDRGV